jgi:hypothetical protein
MTILIFNLRGIVMVAVSLAVGIGVANRAGWQGEGPAMLIAGPLTAALDGGWRVLFARPQSRWWFSSEHGGSLFWLPVWSFGALWLVLGASYTWG